MHSRWTTSGVFVGLLAAVLITRQAPHAQTSALKSDATAKDWTAPRTSWGEPDLQGVWSCTPP